jgi:hypothetical protein
LDRTRLSASILTGAVAILITSGALAQGINCSGISDVSDFDGATVSDFNGLLATVQVATPAQVWLPILVTSPIGDVHRVLIVGQDGVIRLMKDGVVQPTPFIDLSGIVFSEIDGGKGEQGLLGFAFHPSYDSNGWFFVHYTESAERDVVARFTRSAQNPDVADPASRVEVIAFDYPNAEHHFGGMLAFSPIDGRLYISTGDGGDPCDAFGNAPNLASNLGKILRLSVESLPYSTSGNPFDGSIPGNDEIWASGLRNPWRFSFDRANGALYIGDVGQSVREEIDCRPSSSAGGESYGWPEFEGAACPNPSCGSTTCADPGVLPIHDYEHSDPGGFACAVTAGYVYKGCRMKDLRGTYFFADFCADFVRTFRTNSQCARGPVLDRTVDLQPGGGLFLRDVESFGEDARGEIYIATRFDGILKIVPTLGIVEVSGVNAAPFLAGDPDWSWESLMATSSYPVAAYKVYRSSSPTTGFTCVHQEPSNAWPGGDPESPPARGIFYYLVTAVSATGEESRAGKASNGVPRVVDTLSACAS